MFSFKSVLLLSIVSGFSYVSAFKCPRDDEYSFGKSVSIDIDITSDTTYEFSWSVPNGGVELINLEYICYTEGQTPPEQSKAALLNSEKKQGSALIEITDLESPIECVVYGCYLDNYWYDLFKIESKTFKLEVQPVILLSPSPSPLPPAGPSPPACPFPSSSPPAGPSPTACECNTRIRRDTAQDESAGVHHITGDGALVLGIVLVLSVIICILVAINAVLVLKMKKMKKEIPVCM